MKCVVVGGGWSGMAAAVYLAQFDTQITVIEAAAHLGGRARTVRWAQQNWDVDNGQHLLVGAYQAIYQLLRMLELDPTRWLNPQPLDLTIFSKRFAPIRLNRKGPLPWRLALGWNLYRSIGLREFAQVCRLLARCGSAHKQADCSLAQMLAKTQQSPRLQAQLWEPLCLAMLNTPMAIASFQLFSNCLMQLFSQKHHSDICLINQTLGTLFPEQAKKFLTQKHHQVLCNMRIKRLIIEDNRIRGVENQHGEVITADCVILATPLQQARQLLPAQDTPIALHHEPITTVYLRYSSALRLPMPVFGSIDGLAQWWFDRSDQHPGLFAAVISGNGPHRTMHPEQLANTVAAELRQWCPGLPESFEDHWVICEKRATFVASIDINRQRPHAHTGIAGLWLCSDAVRNAYPATLEGAVVNARDCVYQIMSYNGG